jgi:hypothetical protein
MKAFPSSDVSAFIAATASTSLLLLLSAAWGLLARSVSALWAAASKAAPVAALTSMATMAMRTWDLSPLMKRALTRRLYAF